MPFFLLLFSFFFLNLFCPRHYEPAKAFDGEAFWDEVLCNEENDFDPDIRV